MPLTYDANTDSFLQVAMPTAYDPFTDSFINVFPGGGGSTGGGGRGGSTYVNMTVQEFLSSPPTFFAGTPVEQARRDVHNQMRKLKPQSSIGKHRIIPFPDLKDKHHEIHNPTTVPCADYRLESDSDRVVF